jgi:hypothetical protein
MLSKKVSAVWVSMLVLCGALALAQDAFIGTYKGSWEGGGGAGRFDITVTKGADGKLSGGVSVGQDGGDYEAKFTSAVIEGGELKARYSYTPEAQADIVLTGKSVGGVLSGTWAMVEKGAGAEGAQLTGTWTAKK